LGVLESGVSLGLPCRRDEAGVNDNQPLSPSILPFGPSNRCRRCSHSGAGALVRWSKPTSGRGRHVL